MEMRKIEIMNLIKKLTAIISVLTACSTSSTAVSTAAPSASAVSTPTSVVALSKSIADMWLLSGGTLSGVTEDALELSDLNSDAVSIGTLTQPSYEQVVALDPDLVLMTSDIPAHVELKTQLEDNGIKCMTVEVNSFEDYSSYMKQFTDLTGDTEKYTENVTDVQTRINDVLDSIPSDNEMNGKTYLLLRISATKNKVLKEDYFASEIINAFGLKNITDDNSSLDDLSVEAIVSADPDYIFLIPSGSEEKAKASYEEQFASQPAWSDLSAMKSDHVIILPKDLFGYKPNSQWDKAYEYIDSLLYQES
jgi:iron complex transport system substrate-binding protein